MSRFGTQVISTIALSALGLMLLDDGAEAVGGQDKKPKIGLPIKLFPGKTDPAKTDPAKRFDPNTKTDIPARNLGAVARGTVSFVSDDKRTLGVTDFLKLEGITRERRFTLHDMHIVNRGGIENRNGLRVGDEISFFFDASVEYVLVHEGSTKNSTLSHGTFNGYDGTTGQISLNFGKVNYPYSIGNARTGRLGLDDGNGKVNLENIRIGQHVLVVSNPIAGRAEMAVFLVRAFFN